MVYKIIQRKFKIEIPLAKKKIGSELRCSKSGEEFLLHQ
jgi:hypothetical protein